MKKIHDAIYGLAVGDALGVPAEFRKRDSYKITDMVGYGTHGQPAGTWSDDSSMTFATMSSLIKHKGINYYDMMTEFLAWMKYGWYTPHDEVFDIGNTTKVAITRFDIGEIPSRCGCDDVLSNGNGSLMRILPLAFVDCTDEEIKNVSALTHAHEISKEACVIYVTIAKSLLAGKSLYEAISDGCKKATLKEFDRIPELIYFHKNDIKSSGYVVDTLEAALWCLLDTDNYRDCVLEAVNLGSDTDTVGAVTGGLAGILWGVPEEWKQKLAKNDEIERLCNEFEKTFAGGEAHG